MQNTHAAGGSRARNPHRRRDCDCADLTGRWGSIQCNLAETKEVELLNGGGGEDTGDPIEDLKSPVLESNRINHSIRQRITRSIILLLL
jgi:hypothetical protein